MDFDSKRQNHCAHFCGLLRETELYTYFIFQAAPNRNRLGMSSGQSTMSEEENDPGLGSSSVGSTGGLKNPQSSEDSTLTLNDGVMSRQSSTRFDFSIKWTDSL